LPSASGYLLATVRYQIVASSHTDLYLHVGQNTIVDTNGLALIVIFGPGSYVSPGDLPGATDAYADAIQSSPGPKINDLNLSTIMPGVVWGTVTADTAASWSQDLLHLDYTPAFGASANAPGLHNQPSWNAATQFFSWDTSGSTNGIYTWYVTAKGNDNGTGLGRIIVRVGVPEPSTLALAIVAFGAVLSWRFRRNPTPSRR
jgi:hypothetical protein